MNRSPADLPAEWRARASLLRDHGAEAQAKTLELAAAELEQALRVQQEGTLNLTEAAAACGYSADHLGQLVREGKIPNLGRKGAPRVRREDLPPRRGPAPADAVRPKPTNSARPEMKVVNTRNLQ